MTDSAAGPTRTQLLPSGSQNVACWPQGASWTPGSANSTPRERAYIEALTTYYTNYDQLAPQARAKSYSDAMSKVAAGNPADSEAQVFYSLSLLGTASLTDKTHPNQKKAAEILEPLYKKMPMVLKSNVNLRRD